ncbi:hypothetical protein SAY86_012413 [Trapa natans]|uniref:Uncharacterized protein n=1 Tax=Trapa natans TaxID=22666 RepID=A0AAN7R745_TRANT|nr:hypothetical protein SAY86_012413 [Trapa natans]
MNRRHPRRILPPGALRKRAERDATLPKPEVIAAMKPPRPTPQAKPAAEPKGAQQWSDQCSSSYEPSRTQQGDPSEPDEEESELHRTSTRLEDGRGLHPRNRQPHGPRPHEQHVLANDGIDRGLIGKQTVFPYSKSDVFPLI